MPVIEVVAAVALAALCVVAVWMDVAQRRIANAVCLLTWAGGLAAAAATSGFSVAADCLLHSLVALAVGIALFAVRIVGGGDAKFYAAVAAWMPLKLALALVVTVSLSGLAAFMTWFVWRRFRGIPIRKNAASDRDRFPYAIAIAIGAFAVYPGLLPALSGS